ncbi:hypothetical protein GCM10010393_29510 [Streptomyces gobitricini]|uniref:Uncharacterized protein n=1 Tax=Streptomyces gobitricini TaxID=68211 RepID=A0ABN3M4A7_9ACTN
MDKVVGQLDVEGPGTHWIQGAGRLTRIPHMDEYGVARLTARRAAQELRERVLVITVGGKGSFVVEQLPGEG